MLDIGWSELLVIAIVLIVVVGPKDLPPMIRAFGKTMAGLRKMAGDFRSQFDEALKEADMDDVRQTISDVRNLNPTNSLRDAMNPLRQLGNDIRADLQHAATPPSSAATSAPAGAPAVSLDEPDMKLPDSPPPAVAPVPAATVTAQAVSSAPNAPVAVAPAPEKPKRTRKAPAKSEQEIEAETVVEKPKRAPRTIAAKPDAKKAKPASIADMAAEPAITPALTQIAAKATKPRTVKSATEKTAATKKAADLKADVAAQVKKTKTVKAKKDEA